MKNEKTFQSKFSSFFKYINYYKNLQKGLSSGDIYHNLKNQNPELNNLIQNFKKNDLELMETLFKKDLIQFLGTQKLDTYLDFSKKLGTKQIGFNTIYTEKPSAGIWTTGKGTFLIPTKIDKSNKIIIEFYSIPPVNVVIGFENDITKNVNMPKLTLKKVDFVIESSKIRNSVSEIFVTTDRLWRPSVIMGGEELLPLGICIKSIHVSYF